MLTLFIRPSAKCTRSEDVPGSRVYSVTPLIITRVYPGVPEYARVHPVYPSVLGYSWDYQGIRGCNRVYPGVHDIPWYSQVYPEGIVGYIPVCPGMPGYAQVYPRTSENAWACRGIRSEKPGYTRVCPGTVKLL